MALVCSSFTLGCSLLRPLPAPTSLDTRLAAFPQSGLPLERPVRIRWNHFQVPFIEAETDTDAAFALGMVHAHLRRSQMELILHAAEGRLSELFGPFTADIDEALRIIDIPKAVPQIEAALPAETRQWLSAFVQGINSYIARQTEQPHEYRVLPLSKTVWSVRDILTLSRLYTADVTWISLVRYLRLGGNGNYRSALGELADAQGRSVPSYGEEREFRILNELLEGLSRSGSNSVVVSGARSESGAPMMANDPHLGVLFPNIWLLAGLKSPSYHMVGMMLPGAPFVALGRNPEVAWGGTNMHTPSSSLFDVSTYTPEEVTERRVRIKVRFWRDRQLTIRETSLGPLISDASFVREGGEAAARRISLRWVGHQPSDEITAFLRVNRSRTFEEFRDAFESYRVSAQNMLYADRHGNIGQVAAYGVPLYRSWGGGEPLLNATNLDDTWVRVASPRELPAALNPDQGFLVSANNVPFMSQPPLGATFPPNDRVLRLRALVEARDRHSLQSLSELQQDTFSQPHLEIRDALMRLLLTPSSQDGGGVEFQRWLGAFADWDGRYAVDSPGASAFHAFVSHTVPSVLDQWCKRRRYDESLCEMFSGWSAWPVFFLKALDEIDRDGLAAVVSGVRADIVADFTRYPTWGTRHTVTVSHPLGRIPVLGRRYRFFTAPVPGSSETLYKMAHPLAKGRVDVRYGSISRQISDLADPDANYFVLFGGQDGWIRSSTSVDQIPLWQEGRYIQMPLTPEGVAREFPVELVLGSGGETRSSR